MLLEYVSSHDVPHKTLELVVSEVPRLMDWCWRTMSEEQQMGIEELQLAQQHLMDLNDGLEMWLGLGTVLEVT